jgi:hypothetical protein
VDFVEVSWRLNSGNACYHSGFCGGFMEIEFWECMLPFRPEPLLSSVLKEQKIRLYAYKTIILSVVLYRCVTWSLTLREEHRLGMFENWVLRRIFGSKRD